jgi:hemerythrin-like metal-binding protein
MIQWNSTLETGHALVDQDHKQLVASLNELEAALKQGAGQEQIEKIIAFLNRYTREHFIREEMHMQRVACPAYAENCKEHRAFVAKLDEWVAKLQYGASTTLVLDVYRETANWIRGHILRVDCKLRGCARAA